MKNVCASDGQIAEEQRAVFVVRWTSGQRECARELLARWCGNFWIESKQCGDEQPYRNTCFAPCFILGPWSRWKRKGVVIVQGQWAFAVCLFSLFAIQHERSVTSWKAVRSNDYKKSVVLILPYGRRWPCIPCFCDDEKYEGYRMVRIVLWNLRNMKEDNRRDNLDVTVKIRWYRHSALDREEN